MDEKFIDIAIEKNVNFLKSRRIRFSNIETCLHVLSTDSKQLSDTYEYVEHNGIRYDYKCYRVFASLDHKDGKILKVKNKLSKKTGIYNLVGEKFADTPDKCFIENGDIHNMPIPIKLDRSYYINLAKKRLLDFGIKN